MSEDRADRALGKLDSPPTSSWRDVRRVALLRRRMRVGPAVGAVVVAAVAAAIVVLQLGSSGGGAPPTPPLAAGVETGARIGTAVQIVSKTAPLSSAARSAVASVARSEQDFTAALLKHLISGTDNVSVSPASLAVALSMLQNGARGNTQSEIRSALQASGISSSDLDRGWAGLTSQWADSARAAGIEFSAANSLWQQRGLPLRKEFLAALSRYYASGVWQVDFGHHMPDALSAIDTWTAQHTNGKITKLFDQLDPSTVLVLANAVYFHAAWQTPFDGSETRPGVFLGAHSRSTANFMTSPGTVASSATADYQAAQLPYRGGRFAALAIMPNHGSLPDFVAKLDGGALRDIAASLPSRSVVKLPRFTTTTTTDLVPVLKDLGIREALSDTADFSALSPTRLGLKQAIQRVYLKVGEKGTEAAAVTGLGMTTLSGTAEEQISFNHPFLFLVRDTRTGAILFASAIQHPDPT